MCKLYQHPVQVQTGPGGQPFSFAWRGHWYLIIESYTYEIKLRDKLWYRNMGLDPNQERLRCVTDSGFCCDLIQEKGAWVLERVWD